MPDGMVSVTDARTARACKANIGYVQGYNAQAVVDEDRSCSRRRYQQHCGLLAADPMITTAIGQLERAGAPADRRSRSPTRSTGTSSTWTRWIANKHVQVLIAPDSGTSTKPRQGWTDGRYAWMRTVLSSPHGKPLYRKRKQMIEPVFAHTKHNRTITRFLRRVAPPCAPSGRLLMATHNLPSSTATTSPPWCPKQGPTAVRQPEAGYCPRQTPLRTAFNAKRYATASSHCERQQGQDARTESERGHSAGRSVRRSAAFWDSASERNADFLARCDWLVSEARGCSFPQEQHTR